MDYDVYQDLLYVIKTFQQETGMSKREFVLVVHPDCPMFNPATFQTVHGVRIITHSKMNEMAVGAVSTEYLSELDEVITDLGLDKPNSPHIEVIPNHGVEIEVEFVTEEAEAIEMVHCADCGHPVSVLNSQDYENVVCPWCNKVNDIHE